MRERAFVQVDVFSSEPLGGNPVAVVLDADGMSDEEMQRFARWTNLSETTFVLPPTTGEASYRVRIFTPTLELPFAGHPTLGTCHAWIESTGAGGDTFVQECAAGLVEVRRGEGGRLAFAGPPIVRSGEPDEETLDEIVRTLQITREDVLAAQWAENGPPWVVVLLADAEQVLSIQNRYGPLDIGVVGFHPEGSEAAIEVRAFFDGFEDPVTGSLNAGVAEWLLRTDRITAPYVAAQGTRMQRVGRVHVDRDAKGTIWVGGDTTTVLRGTASL